MGVDGKIFPIAKRMILIIRTILVPAVRKLATLVEHPGISEIDVPGGIQCDIEKAPPRI
jgi:hypothetical protein